MSALVIGLCAGLFCYVMVAVVKARFGYDDSPMHSACTARGGRWELC